MELLVATSNSGKIRELRSLLAGLPLNVLSLSDAGITEVLEESGATFEENAVAKAVFYARSANLPAIADDSGLVIDHLNGAPGVRSARWAGESANDEQRIAKVLDLMRGVDGRNRSARFVCAAAFAEPAGQIVSTVEGICEGTIANRPRGRYGFGYDPIFFPDGYALTFGELPPGTKHLISHRARAVAKIIPFLQGFFDI